MAALISQLQTRTTNDEHGVVGGSRELISKLPPAGIREADLVLDVLFGRQLVVMLSCHTAIISSLLLVSVDPARGNRGE